MYISVNAALFGMFIGRMSANDSAYMLSMSIDYLF